MVGYNTSNMDAAAKKKMIHNIKRGCITHFHSIRPLMIGLASEMSVTDSVY